ncbi:MAG: DUF935 domain-containing protein [Chitinispirillia bacterium]|nr:DUF935 domain-containing protein [Chitinispirillia bacterium]MCL2268590.1 DUF935 domain-containing protein [Chitinispirillia bacterium]
MNSIDFASRSMARYLTREIAAGNLLNMWGRLYANLPNPDPVLRKLGQPITVLNEIRRENHVSSCAQSREAAVTKKRWAISRDNATERAAETVEAAFKKLNIRNITREMCEAWGYGYQISEIVWERQGDLLLPCRVFGRPRIWFAFGAEHGELRLRSSAGDMRGVPVDDYKFLLTQHRASWENPYGEGAYSSCFWPVTFKKGGLRFWATFIEKFGMPHVVGKLPRGASKDDRNDLLNSLAGMVQDAIAVVPDDSSIDATQVNVTGSSDAYSDFAAYHDGEISTAILGHSAGATSTPGRLGGDDMAAAVRADLVEDDQKMVEETMNTLIAYIHELNPSLGVERPRFELYDEKDIDKQRAERDTMLMNTGKVRLTKKYFVDKYDFAEDEIEIIEQPDPLAPPQFAAAPARRAPATTQAEFQLAVDTLAGELPDETIQAQIEDVLNPALEAINSAESFDDVIAALPGLYGDMDTAEIQKTAEKTMLLGETWGRISSGGSAQ